MSVSNFNACLAETLKWEGGWSDNPRDPGGATNHGITLRTYSQWLRRPATKRELLTIDSETVSAVYHRLFWLPIGGDALPSGVDMMLFDIAINNGDGREHQWAIATANLSPSARVARLDYLRRGFWRRLASFSTFGIGWFHREKGILAVAQKMLPA